MLIYKDISFDQSHAEACMRAIDKIRSKYSGYDYSYQDGRYKSPYQFDYNKNTIDLSMRISTEKYTTSYVVGSAMFWNLDKIVMPIIDPVIKGFGWVIDEVKVVLSAVENHSFSELILGSCKIVATGKISEKPKEKNIYFR